MTAAPYIWYELMTTDVSAAKEFYGKVAGWTFSENDHSGIPYTFIAAAEDQVGGVIELPEEAAANGARPAWLGYIMVDDVDTTVAAIIADGGAVHMPATDIPMAGRIALVADPQSVPFYVMTPSGEGQSKAFLCEPKLGHFAWNELYAGDLATAQPFYQKHFGWEILDSMDMGPMGKYQLYGLNDGTMLGGMMTKPAEMPRPMWLYYIGVEDSDAALQRAKDAGANIVHGPSEVPGDLFIFQGIDPQGAMFACVGPKT